MHIVFFHGFKKNHTYVESTEKGPVGELLYNDNEMASLARTTITYFKIYSMKMNKTPLESLESQLSNGMHNSDLPNYQIMVFWSAPVLYCMSYIFINLFEVMVMLRASSSKSQHTVT